MSNKEEKPKSKSRREFLQEMGIVGVGAVVAGSVILAGINYDKGKKQGERIKVLTAENELLEIDKNDAIKAMKPKSENLTLQIGRAHV